MLTHWLSPDYRKITDIRVREAIGYAYPYKQAEAARAASSGSRSGRVRRYCRPYFPRPPGLHRAGTPQRAAPTRTRRKRCWKQAGYKPGEYVLKWPYITTEPGFAAQTRVMVDALDAAGFDAKPYPTPSFAARQRDGR